MIYALAGNQNCGKTTLFNQLTGSNQHVGNFPGVTVDSKMGEIRGEKGDAVVDLPGIYSIRPYTNEELVTRRFLLKERPDGIINIVDATNIERNLYLTLQLLEMHIPMVLALNMMDEVRGNGGTIDIAKMEEELGIPVVAISAAKNEGIEDLIHAVREVASKRVYPGVTDFCEKGPVHRCIHAVSHQVEDHAERIGISPRFAATKIVEGDRDIIESLQLSDNEMDLMEHSIVEMERDSGMDRNAALADMRYAFIEKVCAQAVIKCRESREHRRSVRIDSVLTNRYLAIPSFLAIMLLVFWLTFGVIGAYLSDLLSMGIDRLAVVTQRALETYGINPVVESLVIDGIFAGVGSVLSFLPIIVVLFFFLSILEDSGYMARIAFVMDRPLRKIGLSGKSFVSMLIGFGCSVPAVMSTRTLASERDKKMTIMLIPFISCSAKIPIYALFAAAFFRKYQALVMIGLYALGIAVGIVSAVILRRTLFSGKPMPFVMELPNYRFPSAKSVALLMWDKARDFIQRAFTIIFIGKPMPFVMELPNYRFPSAKSVALLMWEKAKDFIQRAFTIIFIATLIIWFLQTFDMRLNVVTDSGESLLAMIGKLIAPLFAPMGVNDWRAATALISGFSAKEAVVSTLSVLTGAGMSDLGEALGAVFTPLSAASYLVFTLLYTPCVAAVATIRREIGSAWKTVGIVCMQCAVAWLTACVFYQMLRLCL